MLPPNNNYYPYQGPPATNNYTFDLKLNVDFNNGRVGLGLPHNSPPFQKNHQVPLVYTEPSHVTPISSYQVPIQRNKPVIHQIPSVWQPVPQYARHQPSNQYQSIYNPQNVEQSYYVRLSQNQKGRSNKDSYPESSFSMGVQKSVEAVVCVICDKPINRDQFHQHIEQHKKRRLEYGKKEQIQQVQEPQKVNSFSVRNQNSLENVAEIYRQPPSHYFQNNRILGDNVSRLENSRNVSRQRYIEDTQSRIVYAPAHALNNLNSDPPSRIAYNSVSSWQNQQMGFQSVENSRTIKPVSTSQGNSLVQNSSLYYQNNKVSKVGSMSSLMSGLGMRQETRKLSQNKQISHKYYQENSRNSSLVRNARQQNKSNNYLDGTSSRVFKTSHKQKQPSFEEIEQSVIHRINDHSHDYSMLQLKKQLEIEHIEEQSSSDDQPVYLSVRPGLSTKVYESVGRSKHSLGMTSSSNMTQKLNRTKMPKNYLAREQFIVNTSLTRSCFKSRHSIWK